MSMDNLLEYRVEVCSSQLAKLALSGIKEKRPNSAGNSATFDDELIEDSLQVKRKTPKGFPPDFNMPVIPVSIVRQVHPGLVTDYEVAQEKNVCGARVSDAV
jgi:Holliday junction resolvase YEN1